MIKSNHFKTKNVKSITEFKINRCWIKVKLKQKSAVLTDIELLLEEEKKNILFGLLQTKLDKKEKIHDVFVTN
jgi:hypothetical protein